MAKEALNTPPESANVTTAALLEAFLEWSHRHNEPATYEFYRVFLQSFCDLHGAVPVRDLKPFHVTRWLDGQHRWGQSTQSGAITALKRVLNWATDEGLIPANPLKNVKKPTVKHRERILVPAEQKVIAEAPRDEAFKQFLFALEQTGCRPGELASVAADQLDLDAGTWTFVRHKTVKRTHKPRVVFLTGPMVELCRKLIPRHPCGPLFRNSRGQPWSCNAIRCRFRRLRKKLGLGKDIVAYAYRHTFATNGLAAGVPIATMAELLGHTSTLMISTHYGHLDQKTAHLRECAQRATGPRAGV
jgi:integrase